MNRIYKTHKALLQIISDYEAMGLPRDKSLDWERIHMVSCAKIGLMLATERGLPEELAAIACTVHDFGRIVTGKNSGHAEAGYEPVKTFLKGLSFIREDEIEPIARAVRNHSKKGEIGEPLDELVKDADLLDFRHYGFDFEREDQRIRFERLNEGTVRKG